MTGWTRRTTNSRLPKACGSTDAAGEPCSPPASMNFAASHIPRRGTCPISSFGQFPSEDRLADVDFQAGKSRTAVAFADGSPAVLA